MRALPAVLIFASTVLFGQPTGLEIIRRSIATAERGWKTQQAYKYTERSEERHVDSRGKVKSADVDVTRIVFINGVPFEETIGHNGGPPTSTQKRKDQEKLRKLKAETPAERSARLQKEQENRTFLQEVPEAFNFRVIGTEQINGRPAWVLEPTPKPGYRAHSKYGKMFSKVRGTLWVDQQDYGWVKVDATVIEPIPMGLFLARIQRGSHIFFEQTRVADGIWLPKRIEVTAAARVLFVMNYTVDELITYSDYLPAQPTELASSAGRP
jgi:hypothetical protein